MSSPSAFSVPNNLGTRHVGNNLTAQSQPRGSLDSQELSIEDALGRLEIEGRLKEGAENLLQVLDTRTRERSKEAREIRRQQVTEELNQTNARIAVLKARISDLSTSSSTTKLYRRQRSDEKLNVRPKLPTIKSYSSAEHAGSRSDKSVWSIADIMIGLQQPDQDSAYYIDRANDLVRLLRRHDSVRYDLCNTAMSLCLVRFFTSSTSNIVAAGYRMARQIAIDTRSVAFVLNTGIERCLITSLAKEHKFTTEREQALKLIRSLYTTQTTSMSAGIIRALVSVAESQDRLTAIALQTLAELVVYCPKLMADHGGYRCLLNSLTEGSASLADEIVMVFIRGLDTPADRSHLKAGHDLETIFSPFTEFVEGKRQAGFEDRLMTTTTVLSRMLNSWPGLWALSMYDFRGVKSIIDALRVPASTVRDPILDMIFSVLSITVNNMSSIFLAGRRLTTLGRIPISAETALRTRTKDKRSSRSTLLNQFSALKLLLFLESGLLDALMVVVEDKEDVQASRKATLLIGEVLQLANTLLPLATCRVLQTLPRLFSSAVELQAVERFGATSALFQIESLNRTRNKASMVRITNSADSLNNKRGQRQVEQVKIKMGLQIDDSHFRNLLLDTQVLSTKNYTKWHWDTLTELVQGPLLNPKRLEESIRVTKFMKRLLAFYRPFTHRFSAIRNTKPNQKYVKFGCLLLTTLLANPEGVKYLSESKLLRQLSECLAQMDPMNHVTASDALFSKSRLEETLCHGYFELIGVLTSHVQGIAMIERWRMFSSLYHLTDLRSRGDLVRLSLAHMDYSYEGHPRIIMSKALTTGLLDVRLWATEHLRTLTIGSSEQSRKTAEWAIRLLVTQLYDPNTEVCEAAVRVLEEACNSAEHLEKIVALRPALDHLGDIGAPLLLRFLATSVGFHYLQELNYIDREMDDWFHGRNDEYVVQIEATLLNASSPVVAHETSNFDGRIPAHFYGELAKTEEGVALLLAKGHFARYVDVLQSKWQEQGDPSLVQRVKAALWAIGSIGATERGAPFLKDTNVMLAVVDIATKSQIATLKGTAYLVLGMLSNTTVGVDLLKEYRWEAVLTNMGMPTGICIPDKISHVLNLQPWPHAHTKQDGPRASNLSQDPPSNEILKSMSDLSNHILANDAAQALIRLRRKYPNKFLSLQIYDRAFTLLSTYNYNLGVRRFILELFSSETLQAYMLKKSHGGRPHRGYSLPEDLEINTDATANSPLMVPMNKKDNNRPSTHAGNPSLVSPIGKRVRPNRSATIGS